MIRLDRVNSRSTKAYQMTTCHFDLENRLGDAHGQGKRPLKPLPRHAELAVNMAGSMASFLLATFEAKR
jgi:hypothetical protein